MRTKKLSKKLVLKKKTVAHLDTRQMNDVQGGGPIFECTYTCPQYETREVETCACSFYCTGFVNTQCVSCL